MILDLATPQELQIARVMSMCAILVFVGSRFLGRFHRPILMAVTVAYVLGIVGLLIYALV